MSASNKRKWIMQLASVGAGLCLSWQAHAVAVVSTETTYTLDLDCTDCAAAAGRSSYPVTAQLTLRDYTLGNEIGSSNFVSFRYGGSNLVNPFSVTWAGDDGDPGTFDFFLYYWGGYDYFIYGRIDAIPGTNEFSLGFTDASGSGSEYVYPPSYIYTERSGFWGLCGRGAFFATGVDSCHDMDYGRSHTYSVGRTAVPEPASLALGLLGLGSVAMTRRRRRVS